MRVRDFDDPADEDYERMLDEQRERDERADRFAEKGPMVFRDYCNTCGARAFEEDHKPHCHLTGKPGRWSGIAALSRPQED